MLELNSFAAVRGERQIFQPISGKWCDPGIITLIGANGCGKSSLLLALAGLGQYTGAARWFGQEVNEVPRAELSRMVAYVPQITGLIPPFSVAEFVSLGLYTKPSPRWRSAATRQILTVALERTQTDHLRWRSVLGLSGGEFQRVLWAQALVRNPKILLLDEPFSAVDAETCAVLRGIMHQLVVDTGAQIFLASHHPLDREQGSVPFEAPTGTGNAVTCSVLNWSAGTVSGPGIIKS